MSSDFRWQSVLDFVTLAVAIDVLLRWSRGARALRATRGILALEAGAVMARKFELPMTVWVLHATAVVAGVGLIVLFQPELRHALNRIEIVVKRSARVSALADALDVVSAAAFSLAGARRGALFALPRRDSVNELLPGGIPLGDHVSPEIPESVFRKVSPVHDGATIIERDRITRLGALLPLSDDETLPRTWGTRHRAARGLAQRTHALVKVASEERGEVTLLHDGVSEATKNADDLRHGPKKRVATESPSGTTTFSGPAGLLLRGIAIGLALLVVVTTSSIAGTVVRDGIGFHAIDLHIEPLLSRHVGVEDTWPQRITVRLKPN
ncbi:MAG: diadenylate cyclase [Vicinamibacterales bacterium]